MIKKVYSHFLLLTKNNKVCIKKDLETNILLLNKVFQKMRLIYCTAQVLDTFYFNIKHKLSVFREKKDNKDF